MSVSVEIRRNDFPRIASRFTPAVDDIITLGLMKIHEAADPNTPRDSGDLANNVQVTPSHGGKGGEVHWLMDYAGYVDKGTIFQAPTLFATNAANTEFPFIVRALSRIERQL